MKLFLVRHGETEENLQKIVAGHKNGTLSPLGIKQAKKLGERFKKEKIDAFYCSDLGRAKNTLFEILNYHPNVPVQYTSGLRERGSGDYEGLPSFIRDTVISKSGQGMLVYCKNGIEPGLEVVTRGLKVINQMIKSYPDKTVLALSHNTFISLMLSFYSGELSKAETLYNPKQNFNSGNTAVAELEFDSYNTFTPVKINYFNCMSHLDEHQH